MTGVTVLVVEDQPSMRLLLGTILGQVGYAVIDRVNGASALEYLARYDCGLAIVDIHLPDMSGIDLIRTATARGLPLPPVLGISSTPQFDEIRQAREAGMQTVLKKPIGLRQLSNACAWALTRDRTPTATSASLEIMNSAVLAEFRQLPGADTAQKVVDQALTDARYCVADLGRLEPIDPATWQATLGTLHGVALTLGARRLVAALLEAMSLPDAALPQYHASVKAHLVVLLAEVEVWVAHHFGLLSSRERDCLRLASVGMSSKRIAAQLGIAYATVNFHLRNAALKLQARDRIESVTRAKQLGAI